MRKIAIILAGGKGKRFWPYSSKERPKQLISVFSDKTLLEETLKRIKKLIPEEDLYISTNNELAKQLERMNIIKSENIISEPQPKNTAPTIVYTIALLLKKYGNSIFGIFPADHYIKDEKEFLKTLKLAYSIAESEKKLLTFGIKPSSPATGYGYIEVEKNKHREGFYRVVGFKEKPDKKTAEKYIKAGNFYWNSGMFLWRGDVFIENLKKYSEKFYNFFKKIKNGYNAEEAFKEIEELSIDYALMEKSKEIILIEGTFGWSDIGSWEAVYDILKKDKNGNAKKGNVFLINTKNSLVLGDNETKIAVLGLEKIIVVKKNDKILIAKMGEGQKVKEIFDIIEEI